MIGRRDFLKLSAAGAAACCLPLAARGADTARAELEAYFITILQGFLKNAHATSPDYTACDFPGGTKLATCCTPSGKTYTSVSRMLPAIGEYLSRPQSTHIQGPDGTPIGDIFLRIYRTAFDPKHPDFWGLARSDKPSQRTVESALVAYSLVRAGNSFVARLSSDDRANINKWLASCTQVAERTSNHAWFTAVNQASRLALSKEFPEFKGDSEWLLADLKALDALYSVSASDGWYSDDPKLPVYDYYNFWTFANFPFFFSRVAGSEYGEWCGKLKSRVATFLTKTPYFFGADGSHPLFGRSLIYRFALLSPMVLGYQEKLWPHSPGLLRRIVRKSISHHWDLGAYDSSAGKLRETFTPAGTPDVKETYVDNGHPYWAMQAFTFLSLPDNDPFFTAPEENLPIEKDDFLIQFEGPKMLLAGTKASGQVRWVHACTMPRRDYYRDKYSKLSTSSHFPPNVSSDKNFAPWDENILIRNIATRHTAARSNLLSGKLLLNGVESIWTATLDGLTFKGVTRLTLDGDFEIRTHVLYCPPEAINKYEILEGGSAISIGGTQADSVITNKTYAIGSFPIQGYSKPAVASSFDPAGNQRVNLVHAATQVLTMTSLITQEKLVLASVHYASPQAMPANEIQKKAQSIVSSWTLPDMEH